MSVGGQGVCEEAVFDRIERYCGRSCGFSISISNFREENIAIIREKFEEILYHLLPCQHAMDYSKSAILFLLAFAY